MNGMVSNLNAMKLDYQRMLRDVDAKQQQVQPTRRTSTAWPIW